MNKYSRYLAPLLLFFVFTTAFFILGKSWLDKKEIQQAVLLGGNALLFLTTLLAMVVALKGYSAPKPQAAARGMYGSFMIKFFVIAIAAFIYILSAGKNVNKPALIVCAALYIVYAFIEVRSLTRMLKDQKNA